MRIGTALSGMALVLAASAAGAQQTKSATPAKKPANPVAAAATSGTTPADSVAHATKAARSRRRRSGSKARPVTAKTVTKTDTIVAGGAKVTQKTTTRIQPANKKP